jgi:hypothetical protein
LLKWAFSDGRRVLTVSRLPAELDEEEREALLRSAQILQQSRATLAGPRSPT